VTLRLVELRREAILAHRRRVQALDQRLPPGPQSLQRAASVGLQDSMPRAAVLSIHARVEGTAPADWEHPSLIQLWGPRFQVYVVARQDLGLFSSSRMPDDAKGRRRAEDLAAHLHAFLDGRTTLTYGQAGDGLGVHPNALRYAAATGTVLIRWAGARAPTIWTVPAPDISPTAARVALAERYLHAFGPTTAGAFAKWAGIGSAQARAAFDELGASVMPARSPIGDGWILVSDEPSFRAPAGATAPARLIPSGDAFYLLWGADRELLVPDAANRDALWTSRVWPGALLVAGDVAGTWRRDGANVTIEPWRGLSAAERLSVEDEAAALPLGLETPITVRWSEVGPGG
jgi:DNA glycosylase AlkZ-like